MTEANRSTLDKKENVTHVLADPTTADATINVKGFELAGIAVASDVTLVSTNLKFSVSADRGESFQTLQTPDSAGTLTDFAIDAPAAGKAVALPLDVFAGWKYIRIVPQNTADYTKEVKLALRSY